MGEAGKIEDLDPLGPGIGDEQAVVVGIDGELRRREEAGIDGRNMAEIAGAEYLDAAVAGVADEEAVILLIDGKPGYSADGDGALMGKAGGIEDLDPVVPGVADENPVMHGVGGDGAAALEMRIVAALDPGLADGVDEGELGVEDLDAAVAVIADDHMAVAAVDGYSARVGEMGVVLSGRRLLADRGGERAGFRIEDQHLRHIAGNGEKVALTTGKGWAGGGGNASDIDIKAGARHRWRGRENEPDAEHECQTEENLDQPSQHLPSPALLGMWITPYRFAAEHGKCPIHSKLGGMIPVISDKSDRSNRAIAIWLLVCCLMILLMVVIGGVTRLTESGLSITQWKPIAGILPPLTEQAWREAFTLYQAIPQYRDIHSGMDLPAFKTIFYWEYFHRLWGRLIGLVFAVPFLWFLWRRRIDAKLGIKLGGLFLLGGAQGALGWYMVASGLADRDFVSQYRLAAHLGFAAVIYAATLWVALDLLYPRGQLYPRGERVRGGLTRWGLASVTLLVLTTLVAGGFVAGLHAGLIYNTFPLMDWALVPAEYGQLEPLWRNWFENVAAVQFNHRALAITTLAAVLVVWLLSRRDEMTARARLTLNLLLGAGLVQVGLGIATLLLYVPVPLAAAHQAGAMLLLTAAVAALHAWGADMYSPARASAGSGRQGKV